MRVQTLVSIDSTTRAAIDPPFCVNVQRPGATKAPFDCDRILESMNLCRAQGNLPAALDAFNASLRLRVRLAKADPGNAGWQRDLSVSHAKLANLYREAGEPDKALGALREGRPSSPAWSNSRPTMPCGERISPGSTARSPRWKPSDARGVRPLTIDPADGNDSPM